MRAYLFRIAAALNIASLGTVLYILRGAGSQPLKADDILMMLLFIVTPAFTLFALLSPPER